MKNKALAVKYSIGMEAPYVIAKGRGELTRRLLEIAREHNIPIVEDSEMADTVFEIPLGIIPEKYYALFAELLVFIYRLQERI